MKCLKAILYVVVLAATLVSVSQVGVGQTATVEPSSQQKAQVGGNEDNMPTASPSVWTADPEALKRVTHDIRYMASDEMGGRKPGTPGIKLCEDYIVAEFKKAGVKPLSDGTYLQAVEVSGPRRLVKAESSLNLKGPDNQTIKLQLGANYQQLTSIRKKSVANGDLVFVGYGISAKEHNYDDFRDVDLEGKVVVLLRMEPQQQDANSVFNGDKNTSHSAGSRKAKLAREKGAVAVLIVNDSVTAPDDESDELMAIDRFNRTLCPMAHVKRSVIDGILKEQPLVAPTGEKLKSLKVIEDLIDSNLESISQPIKGWSAELTAKFDKSSIITNNIIGVVEGEGPNANETVIIGGHYDHLGMGGFGSKTPGRKEIHNGADDNATGTAAVVELARRFAQADKKPGRRLVFICFTAEEMGLIGANHYVQNPLFDLSDTVAMINFDMIGWLRNKELTLFNWNTSPQLSALLDRSNEGIGLTLNKPEQGFGGSDHLPFNSIGIPNTFIHSGLNDVYHTPEDDFELINCEGALQVIDYSENYIRELVTVKERPKFGRAVPFRFGVRLEERSGKVVVLGVSRGSIASKIGVTKGDIIVEFAGEMVTKRREVVRLVRKFKGTEVNLKLMRDDKELEMNAKLVAPE